VTHPASRPAYHISKRYLSALQSPHVNSPRSAASRPPRSTSAPPGSPCTSPALQHAVRPRCYVMHLANIRKGCSEKNTVMLGAPGPATRFGDGGAGMCGVPGELLHSIRLERNSAHTFGPADSPSSEHTCALSCSAHVVGLCHCALEPPPKAVVSRMCFIPWLGWDPLQLRDRSGDHRSFGSCCSSHPTVLCSCPRPAAIAALPWP